MDIDSIKINFSQDQLFLLNLILAFLMFGIALDIRLEDFKKIFQRPKSPIVGLTSEYILLPLLTLLLIWIFQPAASLALGMVLIAVCPGGSTSNFMVHLSGANSALSIMLTSLTTLAAIVVTPFAFTFWSSFVPGTESLQTAISVDPYQMVKTIVQLILVPVLIGMFIHHRFPYITARYLQRPIRIISIVLFLGFVVVAVMKNLSNMYEYLYLVFFIVLVHNGLSLLMGYFFSKSMRVPEQDARAISIETGIQNSGLGLILVFNFFDGIGGMAMILAWWGVWHLISGFGLALIWSRYKKPFSLAR
jgi:BASS family bile acid:Na+ symporter